MNYKNERILKLWEQGVKDPAQIVRHLGLSGDSGIERVKHGLVWLRDQHRIENEEAK